MFEFSKCLTNKSVVTYTFRADLVLERARTMLANSCSGKMQNAVCFVLMPANYSITSSKSTADNAGVQHELRYANSYQSNCLNISDGKEGTAKRNLGQAGEMYSMVLLHRYNTMGCDFIMNSALPVEEARELTGNLYYCPSCLVLSVTVRIDDYLDPETDEPFQPGI